MASYEDVAVLGDPAGPTRAERVGYTYRRYRPDQLRDRAIEIPRSTVAKLDAATLALNSAENSVQALGRSEALGRLLLRAEAVASSRIEGLQVAQRRLLEAEYLRTEGTGSYGVAGEVLGNIDAMQLVTERVGIGHVLTLDDLLDTHRVLMAPSRLQHLGGVVRDEQNWIGGSDASPAGAAFVPPAPALVRPLLLDLIDFINSRTAPALVTAAVAHAQFETIHPFADGNGRTGRALIHMVLRANGLAERTAPPVSLILATRAAEYVDALTAFRYEGVPGSAADRAASLPIINLFLDSTTEIAGRMEVFEHSVRALQQEWTDEFQELRRDAAVFKVIDHLPAMPVFSSQTLQAATGLSAPPVDRAISQLVDRGIAEQRSVGRRNRAYEVPALIHASTLLERRLGSPLGDTRREPPSRSVPALPGEVDPSVADLY